MRTRLESSILGILFALASPLTAAAVRVTPSQIPAVIQDNLTHARVPEHGQVRVAFANGVATLSGTVDSLGVKLDAERAARKLDDVTQVVNNLTVRSEDVSDAQILEQARKQIVTYYAYTIFDNLSLALEDHKLVVGGEVTDPYKKADIGNFLTHVKGVAALDNRIEILPLSIYDDHLRSAVARAIYRDPYFARYANQAVPPIHIVVKNGNVTLEGVVASSVDRAKAEADARFAATYFDLADHLRVEGKAAPRAA